MQEVEKNWFANWFDTPYYHILYKERNDKEAQFFISNLVHYLSLEKESTVLDLACGKGRHSIYLNELGFNVLGVDLSENSINIAKNSENDTLKFGVHDMRNPLEGTYDAVLNLFTSFGYFETEDEHIKVLNNIQNAVNETGLAVLDYLNIEYVKQNLVAEETKTIEGITFKIHRKIENNFVIKDIYFEDKGENFHFTEKVKAYSLQDFEQMMESQEIYLLDTFGDYKLNKFYKNTSERLILIFK
jgi:cyclopropane fatty-acyl-phospholipid synthase-like methyltransferase